MNEAAQWFAVATLVALVGYYRYRVKAEVRLLQKELKDARKLISAETKRKEAHTAAFERLTDPESIIEDMEKGARLREMKDANRTTLPRDDAGPPAKVWRPKVRSKLPSRWNPPRP